MWIYIRTMDGKKSVRIDDLSKLTKIEQLREKLIEPFEAAPEKQRLFHGGKQLEDGHSLFDYNIQQNNIIQIMIRPTLPQVAMETPPPEASENESSDNDVESTSSNESPLSEFNEESDIDDDGFESTYKIGDIIDARDLEMGAWFESKVMKISKEKQPKPPNINGLLNGTSTSDSTVESFDVTNNNNDEKISQKTTSEKSGEIQPAVQGTALANGTSQMEVDQDDGGDDAFTYHLQYEGYEDDDLSKLTSHNIRPRAQVTMKLADLNIGEKVMVNYNFDDNNKRGYWYDAIVTAKRNTRTIKELTATVFFGPNLTPLHDCKIYYYDEVMRIEKVGDQKNIYIDGPNASPPKRKNKPDCDFCRDNPKRKCKHCACHKCGGKNDPASQILCDECDIAFHLQCLNPPLDKVPEDEEWYCPLCKTDDNIVKMGEKLKVNKKKSKMASAKSTCKRDWGKGMACAGRTKQCTIVQPDHFGPIPGIEVGTQWLFRVQVSEAGVHRPHVAGIHGRGPGGAFSIVLSGGYEDDKDDGDEFTYTGSGGRDLSGNKRTARQSCDQVLTRMNKALANNCNARVDATSGAEAVYWKGGKPVRVVRNHKGSKHSEYAPKVGNRYDGIYKVVKYWPQTGKSGFKVWRFMFRRDDTTPAPWTKSGKKLIEEKNLVMQYPEGYLEGLENKQAKSPEKGKKKKGRKRSLDEKSPSSTPGKKAKVAAYKLKSDIASLIKKDTTNKKYWDDALLFRKEGSQKFHEKVEELFMCVCCQDIVFQPITTTCGHNICKTCLTRSFRAGVYTCPACRCELGKGYSFSMNKTLRSTLVALFQGYEKGR